MNGDREHEAAEFGRDVGIEMGRAAADMARMAYRFARRMRWIDLAGLAVAVLVLPCFGVWWKWVAVWFAVSLVFDVVTCWKLNPRRGRKRKAGT